MQPAKCVNDPCTRPTSSGIYRDIRRRPDGVGPVCLGKGGAQNLYRRPRWRTTGVSWTRTECLYWRTSYICLHASFWVEGDGVQWYPSLCRRGWLWPWSWLRQGRRRPVGRRGWGATQGTYVCGRWVHSSTREGILASVALGALRRSGVEIEWCGASTSISGPSVYVRTYVVMCLQVCRTMLYGCVSMCVFSCIVETTL